jgi:hypothetical protein
MARCPGPVGIGVPDLQRHQTASSKRDVTEQRCQTEEAETDTCSLKLLRPISTAGSWARTCCAWGAAPMLCSRGPSLAHHLVITASPAVDTPQSVSAQRSTSRSALRIRESRRAALDMRSRFSWTKPAIVVKSTNLAASPSPQLSTSIVSEFKYYRVLQDGHTGWSIECTSL